QHHLFQESVALTLTKGNDRIDRNAVIKVIGRYIPVEDVDSFGNLGDHDKWFIIFKSSASKEKFLTLENLEVDDQVFAIHKPYREVKLVRLLNVPPSISDDYIREIAKKWGSPVISVECETLPRPYQFIKTFVRRVRIKFKSPGDEQNIPISIKMAGINIPILLEGRVKVCHEFGHDDVSCSKQRSYANAISTPSNVNQEINPNSISMIIQNKIKICHKCKQPGHIKINCPVNRSDIIQSPITLLNNDMESRFSTPNVGDSDKIDDRLNCVQTGEQNGIQDGNSTDVPSAFLGDASQNNKRSNEQGGVHENVQSDIHEVVHGGVREGDEAGVQGDVHDGDEAGVQGVVHDGDEAGVQGVVHDGDEAGVHEDVQGDNFECRVVQGKVPTGAQQNMDVDDLDMPRLASNEISQISIQQQTTSVHIAAYKEFKEGRNGLKRYLSDEQHPIRNDMKKLQQTPSSPDQGRDIEDGEL
ncbi:unnamed protein product, partial [Adineta steineri]